MPVGNDAPLQVLQMAIAALQERGVQVLRQSQFFRTPAYPEGSGPNFVNAALHVLYKGSPENLMSLLHSVEADFGRVRTSRWSARGLDLDLLAADDLVLPDEARHANWRDLDEASQMVHAPQELIVPHPRLQDRSFMLVPLADIAPNWQHPILKKTSLELMLLRPQAERQSVVAL